MKKLQIIAVCAIITACFSSCNKEEIADQNLQEEVAQKPTKAQLQKLANMGINIEDVTIEKIPMIDGSFEKHLVSGDITIPIANLDKYADLESLENGNKQFRTPNIVAVFRNQYGSCRYCSV